MHEAIARMLDRYDRRSHDDHLRALREIMQEIALLGLWRGKFFERAAFYGGSALRILYGLDRFSEDLDFSLLERAAGFDLGDYGRFLQRELESFGFDVHFESVSKAIESPIRSAFLKADTLKQLLVIKAGEEVAREVPRGQVLKIKVEIDTDPPSGFSTNSRYLLLPVPFAVRTFTLPDLFAGKMHALLCRRWKTRVKGRDWYDLVWYAANHPRLNLSHLEERMRQSGDWSRGEHLTPVAYRELLMGAIDGLDIDQARNEVVPFVRNPEAIEVWSRDFFRDVASRVVPMGV